MKSKIFSTCILEELWQFVFGNAPEETARTIASTVDRLNLVDAKCSIWHFVKKKMLYLRGVVVIPYSFNDIVVQFVHMH